MQIQIPNEFENFVRDEVQSGRFASATELVGAALRRFRDERATRENGGDVPTTLPVAATETGCRSELIAAFLAEMQSLPVHNPADGFSGREHDRVLYGGRR